MNQSHLIHHQTKDTTTSPLNTKQLLPLFLFSIAWIVLPTLLAKSVALDVSEGINWGHEWQLGYYKHPPFSSWLLYIFYHLFGDIGIYALSVLCVWLSGFCFYQLGRAIVPNSPYYAWLGSNAILLIIYYSYPLTEFNHNVAQLPIWASLVWLFYLALTQNRWIIWLGLGVVGAIGMLTKYHTAFLLLSMAIFLLLPKQQHHLKSAKPWLALILMIGIFLPHLYWLITHDWLPFSYMHTRTQSQNPLAGHFSWIGFLATQLIMLFPLILTLIQAKHKIKSTLTHSPTPSNHLAEPSPFAKQYLKYMFFLPLLILCLFSLLFGMKLRDMWGMPMLGLAGLLALSSINPNHWLILLPLFKKATTTWLSHITIVMVIMVGLSDSLKGKPSRMHYPQQELTQTTEHIWQSLSHCPLDNIAGNSWLIQLIAMKHPNFPSIMISGPAQYSPWINAERLNTHGTLIIAEEGETLQLPILNQMNEHQMVKYQGKWQQPWQAIPNKAPLTLQWTAYIPQSCVRSPTHQTNLDLLSN